MRCTLEARDHDHNSFITLTYSDEHMPGNLSLDKTHLQKFFKRMRKKRGKFRYYACGEYGDHTQRAHYHACIFGLDFADKVELQRDGENVLYYSQELTELWGLGHCSIAKLTFELAAYCARYVLKKKLTTNKQRQHSHYYLDEGSGELVPVIHPYAVMSLGRKKGEAIGGAFFRNFHGDIYNADKDFLVMRGQKMKPPKYFDGLLDVIDPARLERIKQKRQEERKDLSIEELRAHEKNTRARIIQRKKV